ncbi:SusC/RagA family TonB-linked outer membrane protein [Bacteroidia bacterium]|nr:SusC/RagA family TonB-linked outer membrane protein [Bacteroidia bacterium]
MLLPTALLAQQGSVSGKVTDAANGEPLVGVTVAVVGTSSATMTDTDGAYKINVPQRGTLTFSFVGYRQQTISINGRNLIDVLLEEDAQMLDEVVAIGYGTVKKRDLSGAVGQIKADDLLKGSPSASINQALQGKMAGVMVNQSNGAPGAGVTITVRGANSFSTNTQPLFIVDGVPFDGGSIPNGADNDNSNQSTNPLSIINPNNIESLEVLKDASATAIYGSRGANGVVIITTKKGTADGTDRIELSMNTSVATVAKKIDVLNSYDYANYINEQYTNDEYYLNKPYSQLPYRGAWEYQAPSGTIIPSSGTYYPTPEDFLRPRTIYDSYGNSYDISNTNWQDEIFRTAMTYEYNLRVFGGSNKGWHSFSGNFMNQDGVIANSNFKRYNLSANIGRKVHNWIELGTSINFTNSTTNFAKTQAWEYSVIRSSIIFPPTFNPRQDPSSIDQNLWLDANPYMYVNTAKDEVKAINIFSSSYAELTFKPWLKFRQNLGIGYGSNARNVYYGRHTPQGREPHNGLASVADNWWQSTTAESILTFDNTFNKIHHLNIVGGFTYQQSNYGWKQIKVENFPSDVTQDFDLSAGTDVGQPASGRGMDKLMSFLGRINYTLNDRYIFTASYRADGSSKFQPANRWANFFSGALAWRASEEAFIKNLNVFSNLKFRISAGQTGNQGINAYSTQPRLSTANYVLGGSLVSGYALSALYNPDLIWETTTQYNAGIDFGFMNNRLNFTVDVYQKYTDDLLSSVIIPSSSGFTTKPVNSGAISNKGLEITADYTVMDNKTWRWNVNGNISFNRNRIEKINSDQFYNLWWGANNVYVLREGMPLGTIVGFVEDGFYDSEAEVRSRNEYATESDAVVRAMVGEIKYRDFDGDGKISDADQKIIGNTNPDFIYGFTNTLSWKNLTLSFFLQGVYGNDILNGNLTDIEMSNISNITQYAYDHRWTPDNIANAEYPKATSGYNRVWRISDRYVEDGSYLRLKNLSLGYTFPANFVKGIENLYIYASASNLFTISKYSWYDADVNSYSGDAIRKGVDMSSYPGSRTYSIGLKLTF